MNEPSNIVEPERKMWAAVIMATIEDLEPCRYGKTIPDVKDFLPRRPGGNNVLLANMKSAIYFFTSDVVTMHRQMVFELANITPKCVVKSMQDRLDVAEQWIDKVETIDKIRHTIITKMKLPAGLRAFILDKKTPTTKAFMTTLFHISSGSKKIARSELKKLLPIIRKEYALAKEANESPKCGDNRKRA